MRMYFAYWGGTFKEAFWQTFNSLFGWRMIMPALTSFLSVLIAQFNFGTQAGIDAHWFTALAAFAGFIGAVLLLMLIRVFAIPAENDHNSTCEIKKLNEKATPYLQFESVNDCIVDGIDNLLPAKNILLSIINSSQTRTAKSVEVQLTGITYPNGKRVETNKRLMSVSNNLYEANINPLMKSKFLLVTILKAPVLLEHVDKVRFKLAPSDELTSMSAQKLKLEIKVSAKNTPYTKAIYDLDADQYGNIYFKESKADQ